MDGEEEESARRLANEMDVHLIRQRIRRGRQREFDFGRIHHGIHFSLHFVFVLERGFVVEVVFVIDDFSDALKGLIKV